MGLVNEPVESAQPSLVCVWWVPLGVRAAAGGLRAIPVARALNRALVTTVRAWRSERRAVVRWHSASMGWGGEGRRNADRRSFICLAKWSRSPASSTWGRR